MRMRDAVEHKAGADLAVLERRERGNGQTLIQNLGPAQDDEQDLGRCFVSMSFWSGCPQQTHEPSASFGKRRAQASLEQLQRQGVYFARRSADVTMAETLGILGPSKENLRISTCHLRWEEQCENLINWNWAC